MCGRKKYFCSIVTLSCLTASLTFHYLWAEDNPKVRASDQQQTESQNAPLPQANQPGITIDAAMYNAGEVWEGDEVVHTFTVRNTGTAQLTIEKVKPG